MTQPLLNGAGRNYNSSLIVLAEIDTDIARDQMVKELQNVLLEVHKGYWDLYLQRAALLQRRRLYAQAESILHELDDRRDVDVLENQLVRARAALATRQSATIRFETSVRNAESKLRALINDPHLANSTIELVPVQLPSLGFRNAPTRGIAGLGLAESSRDPAGDA